MKDEAIRLPSFILGPSKATSASSAQKNYVDDHVVRWNVQRDGQAVRLT